jgi:hypothetical protein
MVTPLPSLADNSVDLQMASAVQAQQQREHVLHPDADSEGQHGAERDSELPAAPPHAGCQAAGAPLCICDVRYCSNCSAIRMQLRHQPAWDCYTNGAQLAVNEADAVSVWGVSI